MGDTYSQLHIHLIFVVSHRKDQIREEWKTELFNYMVGIISRQGHRSVIINGMPDHVHLLIELNPVQAISELVKAIKSFSTKWVNDNQLVSWRFKWQAGYGAFSHSHSAVPAVIQYIENQENHHRKMNFSEEYKKILEKNGVENEVKYLFKSLD